MDSELFFEGKKYISASRASKITGYNSDYIGQLCRKGELECKRIGRGWFVGEKSLSDHKIIAAQKPRGRIPKTAGEISIVSDFQIPENALAEKPKVAPATEVGADISQSKVLPYDVTPFRQLEIYSAHHSDFLQEENKIPRAVPVVLLIMVILFLALPFILSGDPISKISTGLKKIQSDSGLIIVRNGISESVVSVSESLEGANVALSFASESVGKIGFAVGDFGLRLAHSISLGLKKIAGLPYSMKKIVMDLGSPKPQVEEPLGGPAQKKVRAGITVLPSTGDAEKDEIVKQYVKDSFSDEIKVLPDDSGTSGIINPVFRKQDDPAQGYLYVLVPVKDP